MKGALTGEAGLTRPVSGNESARALVGLPVSLWRVSVVAHRRGGNGDCVLLSMRTELAASAFFEGTFRWIATE